MTTCERTSKVAHVTFVQAYGVRSSAILCYEGRYCITLIVGAVRIANAPVPVTVTRSVYVRIARFANVEFVDGVTCAVGVCVDSHHERHGRGRRGRRW